MTGYTIYYKYSGTPYSVKAEANATSATITGLNLGVTYSINVVANSTTLSSKVTTAPDITIGIRYTVTAGHLATSFLTQRLLLSPSPPPLPPSWLESLSLSPALSLYLVE